MVVPTTKSPITYVFGDGSHAKAFSQKDLNLIKILAPRYGGVIGYSLRVWNCMLANDGRGEMLLPEEMN